MRDLHDVEIDALKACDRHSPAARRSITLLGVFLAGTLPLAGCGGPAMEDIQAKVPSYVHVIGDPKNMIEKALAFCPDKTGIGEIACVKQAISDAKLDAPALAKQLPGCQLGRVCHYEYTTEDRLGYFSFNSAVFRMRWRVEVDLKHPAPSMDAVPVTVKRILFSE